MNFDSVSLYGFLGVICVNCTYLSAILFTILLMLLFSSCYPGFLFIIIPYVGL